jgi:N-acetylglucosamine kinase-like BadF-type ATPase
MKVVLAIDGGGSRTRCLAIDPNGRVLGHAESGPSNHLLINVDIVRRSITEAIGEALSSSGLNNDAVACVSAGLAGVDFDGADAPQMESLLNDLGFDNLAINGDMVIAHAGALQSRPGVVALAGTGSVTLGIGSDGERVKIGGWGPIYGDEGSAYRIGQMALRAAARAYDGRGTATGLTDALLSALGLTNFRETVTRVYVQRMEPREIAALARVAYEVAEAGDEVARYLFTTAADELAHSVEAAAQQLRMDANELFVSYQGSVLESCRLLHERFVEQLKRSLPRAMVMVPEFEPVIGAYLLGCNALGWPFDEGVRDELKRTSKGQRCLSRNT